MPTKPWKPSKGTRIVIGLATLWGPIYCVFFFCFIGLSFFWFSSGPSKHAMPAFFAVIFPLHCLTILLSFALIAVYVVHAATSDRLTQEMRIIWILILFMGNMFAFPIYWWIYLRTED